MHVSYVPRLTKLLFVFCSFSFSLSRAHTGSVFELIGGKPALGMPLTAGIAVVGVPLAGFLFYASILKATAETEEDDKQFLSGKK